jgi:putative colanic acid biosynthesis acetyltransferase WcaF
VDLSRFSSAGFDRGAPRLKEALWVAVRCLCFQTPWPLPSALRAALLRAFGATVGRGVVLRAGINITFPWRLTIGDHVWIGEDVFLLSLASVCIESHVCISQRAFLCTGSHSYVSETFDLATAPITLRGGSWVGAQAFIGPGVEVGRGSVVSAGSVVLREVPPMVLVRGNPAEIVKHL